MPPPQPGPVLHIIEPTLRDQTGHCYSFVNDLIESDAALTRGTTVFHIWMRRDAHDLFPQSDHLVIHKHFTRTLRRLQAATLYRKLLRLTEVGHKVFISTAETVDLILLDLAARGIAGKHIIKGGGLWPYVHWYNPTPRKMKFLRRMARKHPGLEIVCSTDSVKKVFTEAGFERVHFSPYPRGRRNASAGGANVDALALPAISSNPPQTPPLRGDGFQTILYAGAARTDKGFPAVVELVALLQETGSQLPVTLQCSMTHKGEHTPDVAAAIDKLRQLNYKHLTLLEHTLEHGEYQRMFTQAITLQPYDVAMFADRISGVTLDSLTAGSPIIAPAGTWMARQAQRFDAGVVLDDARDPRALLAAIERILGDWDRYAANAARGGSEIVREHDSGKLLGLILGRA